VHVPENLPDRSVAILGCGYVGLTLAVIMADAGFDVLGVEIRDDVLTKLKRGEPQFHELGLAAMLRRLVQQERLRFAKHLPSERNVRVFIITVGTPLDERGRARLDMVENVAREVSSRLKAGDLVVMRSTVKLGTTRTVVKPILDAAGMSYDIAFCPERTLEGQALSELRYLPQIVGGDTLEATVRASQLFQFLTPTTVRVSNLETAEMIKLVDNAQRDVFFAFSNEVARLCDQTTVSAAEVIKAGKLGYPRTSLALPGPVGGPCLSKDPYILAESFERCAVRPDMVLAARRINESLSVAAATVIKATTECVPNFPKEPTVSLLGIAFKGRPPTDDLRGTTAKPILDALRTVFPRGRFRGWDAVVEASQIREFGLDPTVSLDAAISGANLVVIANNHPIFASMPIETSAETMARPGLIYDFWNNFSVKDLNLPADIRYMPFGSAGVLQANA
jgi:UDP-N-acetyl-D-mannosaminuronic acid dehydrogenase